MSTIQATSNNLGPVEDADFDSGIWDMLYDMPAWGISLLVHVGILITLMSFTWVIETQRELEITSTIEPEEIRQEEYVIDTEVSEEIGSKSDLNIAGPSMAAASTSGLDNHREEQERINERLIDAPRQPDSLPTPNEAELMESINLTGTTEHAGGTEGAIDRITQEIAASLRQRKTLVVWMMDESLSMERRREAVAKRFAGIYEQLGALDVGAEEALTSGVVGYGQDVHMLQGEPTADLAELVKAVGQIKNDASGKENVFTAINKTLQVFLPAKRKLRANMMLILVTDERGDDYNFLEDTVRRCTREGVKIYCVGNASIFGREKGYLRTTWEADGETFEEDLPADMGPETVAAEGLQLPFWTSSARGLDRMSSGYGPYTLSRLCTETGGVFFIAQEDKRGITWDSGIMRKYAPDYRPLRDYQRQLATNSAKAALVNAAKQTLLDNSDIPIPQRAFQANNDNILRQQITEAQKPLATLDYYLQTLGSILEAGERDRGKLDSDRWRASYDLAMGRVLAMRVRAFGYNAMLAEMKSSPKAFEKKGSNKWTLMPAENSNAGATVRKLHKKAIEYLTRVIDEHPGTPWAYLASVELGDPLGWQWKESTMAVAANNGGGNNGNNPQFAPEEEQRRREQRRRQEKKVASRPKL